MSNLDNSKLFIKINNYDQIRITPRLTKKGEYIYDLRIYTTRLTSGQYVATGQGFEVPADCVNDLVDALANIRKNS